MGNRSSSTSIQQAPPTGPPALLSAAVRGDLKKFRESWTETDEAIHVKDAQNNNCLHALFSCRNSSVENENDCLEILNYIHNSLSISQVKEAYQEQNILGCTPLWILVAYGNVNLLRKVQHTLFADDDDDDQRKKNDDFPVMLCIPNNQGDTPFLATCSQGNIDMIRFLKEEILTSDQFNTALVNANQKGTTPLQIIVGNHHIELLQYVLQKGNSVLDDQLLMSNTAGLSLFHICSERNAHAILQKLFTYINMIQNQNQNQNQKTTTINNNNEEDHYIAALDQILSLKDKNGANALHVAAFCGNFETVQVWIDMMNNKRENSDDVTNNKSQSQSQSNNKKSTIIIDVLDKLDGQGRTPYWLGMVQGHDTIGKLLAEEGVDTVHPKMVKEIAEAKEKRPNKQQQTRAVDGSALISKQ
jgi:ankyrin repeat protein